VNLANVDPRDQFALLIICLDLPICVSLSGDIEGATTGPWLKARQFLKFPRSLENGRDVDLLQEKYSPCSDKSCSHTICSQVYSKLGSGQEEEGQSS
jgi:hypothetical protein